MAVATDGSPVDVYRALSGTAEAELSGGEFAAP